MKENQNVKHPTPNTQHPTPNTQHPTPNTQHPTPNDLLCQTCRRKLGEASGAYRISIACRRCKQLNHFQAT